VDGEYAAVCSNENVQLYRSLNLLMLSLDRIGRRRSTL
jgi:hypothetical protein